MTGQRQLDKCKRGYSKHSTLLMGFVLALILRPISAGTEMGTSSPEEAKIATPTDLGSVDPFYMATNAGHVANGCSLRNAATCSFNVRGIPNGSTIKRACLYWAYTSTFGSASLLQKQIFFDGSLVVGQLIGNGADACWCS
jgi:hypothetical protein